MQPEALAEARDWLDRADRDLLAAERVLSGAPVPPDQALCHGIDPAFGRFLVAAQMLNPYATQFRYPGGPLEPDLAEAQQALQLARETVDYVHQQLGI